MLIKSYAPLSVIRYSSVSYPLFPYQQPASSLPTIHVTAVQS